MKLDVLFLVLLSLMIAAAQAQSEDICETETECETSDGETCDRTTESCPVCLRKRRNRVTCTDASFHLGTMQWNCRTNETPCISQTSAPTTAPAPAPSSTSTPRPSVTPRPRTSKPSTGSGTPKSTPSPKAVVVDPIQPNDQDDPKQSQTETQSTEDSGGVNAGAIVGFTLGALAVLGIGVAYAYRVVSKRREEFDEEAAPHTQYESKQYTQYTHPPAPMPVQASAEIANPPQQYYQATSAPVAEETYGRSSLYDRFSDSSIDSYATNNENRRVNNASNLDADAGSEASRGSFEF